ncbi:MAG: hypothetical protein NVS2B12_07970 [Ktedonobacteraceae bacterium]
MTLDYWVHVIEREYASSWQPDLPDRPGQSVKGVKETSQPMMHLVLKKSLDL